MKAEDLLSIAMSIASLLERTFRVTFNPLVYKPTNHRLKNLEGYVVEAKIGYEWHANVIVMPDSISVRTAKNSITVQYHDPNMYDIITDEVCRGVPSRSCDTSTSGMGLYA